MSEQARDQLQSTVTLLRKWQRIERLSMEQTGTIMERTANPFLRLVMEIIRHDSLMHHRVLQTIVDSVTRDDLTLDPDEIAEVWRAIEAHDATEREVQALGQVLRDMVQAPIQRHLLDYLITDEEKHDRLLEYLGVIKDTSAPRRAEPPPHNESQEPEEKR